MKQKTIGIFDSGSGGLSVLSCLLPSLKQESLVFLADTAHLPYGDKSEEEILRYVKANLDFLARFHPKAVLIGCNTADSVAYARYRDAYPFPLFSIISVTSQKALQVSKYRRIGVIATHATISKHAYANALKALEPTCEVYEMACPKLVHFVEDGITSLENPELCAALHEYLDPLKAQGIDTLILGCTHYPLLSKAIQTLLPEVTQVSSSQELANSLLNSECLTKARLKAPSVRYCVTSDPLSFKNKIQAWVDPDFDGEAELVRLEEQPQQ